MSSNLSSEFSHRLLQKYRKLIEDEQRRSASALSAKSADDVPVTQYRAKPINDDITSDSSYLDNATKQQIPNKIARKLGVTAPTGTNKNNCRSASISATRARQDIAKENLNSFNNINGNSIDNTTVGLNENNITKTANNTIDYDGDDESFLIDGSHPLYTKLLKEKGSITNAVSNDQTMVIESLRSEQKRLIQTIKSRAAKAISEAQESAEKCVNELRVALRQSSQEKEELRKQIRDLKTKIHIQKTDMETLLRKNMADQQRFLHEKKCLEAQLAEVTAESLGLRKDLDAKEEMYANSKSNMDALCNERIRVASDIATARCDSLQQQISKMQVQLKESQNEKLVLLKQVSIDMRKLAGVAEENKKESDKWMAKAEETKRCLALSRTEMENLKAEMKMLESENEQLKERNERLTRELIRTDKMIFGNRD